MAKWQLSESPQQGTRVLSQEQGTRVICAINVAVIAGEDPQMHAPWALQCKAGMCRPRSPERQVVEGMAHAGFIDREALWTRLLCQV